MHASLDIAIVFQAMNGLSFVPQFVFYPRVHADLYSGLLPVLKDKMAIQFSPVTYQITVQSFRGGKSL